MSDFTKDELHELHLYDDLWGLIFCDAKETFFYGCPNKEELLQRYPSSQYANLVNDNE